MYIPTLLIVVFAVVMTVFIYSYFETTKTSKEAACSTSNYSYRLDLSIDPSWDLIYKKIYDPKSDKDWESCLNRIIRENKKDKYETGLFGRSYNFTEYYDAVSGLIQRFQTTKKFSGERSLRPVENFGDFGYILEADRDVERRAMRGRFAVAIEEGAIWNNIFDEHVGGLKSFPEKEDFVYRFPLEEVFGFLFAVGQRFPGLEKGLVLKWPENIEKQFDKLGIKYELFLEYDPTPFNMEGEDKEFFERIGRPKIARSYSGSSFLISKYAHYGIGLSMFRPGENQRTAYVDDQML